MSRLEKFELEKKRLEQEKRRLDEKAREIRQKERLDQQEEILQAAKDGGLSIDEAARILRSHGEIKPRKEAVSEI